MNIPCFSHSILSFARRIYFHPAMFALFMAFTSVECFAQVERLTPFSLPWDGTSPAAKALTPANAGEAGRHGDVRIGSDGHLYSGENRLRLFGVNFSFGAGFPDPDLAPVIARRLAGFGINSVRFHHMDMNRFPNGIRDRRFEGTSKLDPEALDRLDTFLFELKKQGIYANLNLLVSRPFNAEDGLPAEIESMDWKNRHIVGFFNPRMIELQKDYARNLLSRVNRHTGVAYKDDPSIPVVEINNENGLVHAWLAGDVDELPEVFKKELRQLWNVWLRGKYDSHEEMAGQWEVDSQKLGGEILKNADFADGARGWNLERHAGAEAETAITPAGPGGMQAARIEVARPGSAAWHVQLNQGNLNLSAMTPYTLRFSARSENQLPLSVLISQAHDPWNQLGFNANVSLDEKWNTFEFTFRLSEGDTNARLNFSGLGAQTGSVEIAGISLRPGGTVGLLPGEDLAAGSIGLFQKDQQGRRTQAASLDFMTFLYETEEAYWQAMYHYLKDELGVKGIVIGTIAGCAPVTLMAELDAVDTHAYWKHPRFPGRPWDSQNWVIDNVSMVTTNGGVLNGLAKKRVFGKPHFCTEYNHPAPNTFSSEAPLLIAAMAALQDWDGIYLYSYKHGPTGWDTEHITSFFDIHSHPTKMANVPLASAIFLRGDMAPAEKAWAISLTQEKELRLLRDKASAWSLVDASSLGMPNGIPLLHRIGLSLPGISNVPARSEGWDSMIPDDGVWASDTRQMEWDLSEPGREHVLIETPKTMALVGFTGGRTVELGDFGFRPGATFRNWNTIGMTLIEGDSWKGPARAILVATAYCQNTGMQWKDAAMDSVGRNWGSGPVLIEAVPLSLEIPLPPEQVKAWSLDPAGERARSVTVQAVAGSPDRAELVVSPGEASTLWYEIELGTSTGHR